MSSVITRRPQRSSAYGRSTSGTSDHWNKIEEPGGRKLWFKLVFGFTLLAVSGTALIALGATLFQHAWDFHEEGNTALPMVLCIISIGVQLFRSQYHFRHKMICNFQMFGQIPEMILSCALLMYCQYSRY